MGIEQNKVIARVLYCPSTGCNIDKTDCKSYKDGKCPDIVEAPAYSISDDAALKGIMRLAERGLYTKITVMPPITGRGLCVKLHIGQYIGENNPGEIRWLTEGGICQSLALAFTDAMVGRACIECGRACLWNYGIDNLWSCPHCHKRTKGKWCPKLHLD